MHMVNTRECLGLGKYFSILWLYLLSGVNCGTRMLEPPSRASLWRYGYNTPTNLYDDKTNCGGYD
ncbi:mucin-5AC, partial [Biomphalaria glabrata]